MREKRKLKYGLRKLSVGVASCFLGSVLYFGGGMVIQAQESEPILEENEEQPSPVQEVSLPTNEKETVSNDSEDEQGNELQEEASNGLSETRINITNEDGTSSDGSINQEFKGLLKEKELSAQHKKLNNDHNDRRLNSSLNNMQPEMDLTKTITRKIHYRHNSEDGEEVCESVVQTITFTRTATIDATNSEVIYSDWHADSTTFEAVKSPELRFYYTNTLEVPSMDNVTIDTQDSEVYVIYKQMDWDENIVLIGRMIHYRYLSEDGEEASNDVFQIAYVWDLIIRHPETGELIERSLTFDPELLDEEVSPVIPGWQASMEVVPADEQLAETDWFKLPYINWYKIYPTYTKEIYVIYTPIQPKEVKEEKTVTRTIHYRYYNKNGKQASDSVVQTITFIRTGFEDPITGEVTYEDWTTDNNRFDSVPSPYIKGWTADTLIVESVEGVKVDSDDIVVYVIYLPESVKQVKEKTETHITDNKLKDDIPNSKEEVLVKDGVQTGMKNGFMSNLGMLSLSAYLFSKVYLMKKRR